CSRLRNLLQIRGIGNCGDSVKSARFWLVRARTAAVWAAVTPPAAATSTAPTPALVADVVASASPAALIGTFLDAAPPRPELPEDCSDRVQLCHRGRGGRTPRLRHGTTLSRSLNPP